MCSRCGWSNSRGGAVPVDFKGSKQTPTDMRICCSSAGLVADAVCAETAQASAAGARAWGHREKPSTAAALPKIHLKVLVAHEVLQLQLMQLPCAVLVLLTRVHGLRHRHRRGVDPALLAPGLLRRRLGTPYGVGGVVIGVYLRQSHLSASCRHSAGISCGAVHVPAPAGIDIIDDTRWVGRKRRAGKGAEERSCAWAG